MLPGEDTNLEVADDGRITPQVITLRDDGDEPDEERLTPTSTPTSIAAPAPLPSLEQLLKPTTKERVETEIARLKEGRAYKAGPAHPGHQDVLDKILQLRRLGLASEPANALPYDVPVQAESMHDVTVQSGPAVRPELPELGAAFGSWNQDELAQVQKHAESGAVGADVFGLAALVATESQHIQPWYPAGKEGDALMERDYQAGWSDLVRKHGEDGAARVLADAQKMAALLMPRDMLARYSESRLANRPRLIEHLALRFRNRKPAAR